jgi:hypothetical protein
MSGQTNYGKEEFMDWKTVLIRFAKVFLATFLVYAGVHITDLQKGTGDEVLHVIIVPALAGAIVATGKAIREAKIDSKVLDLIAKII